jgi:hypothetical protein
MTTVKSGFRGDAGRSRHCVVPICFCFCTFVFSPDFTLHFHLYFHLSKSDRSVFSPAGQERSAVAHSDAAVARACRVGRALLSALLAVRGDAAIRGVFCARRVGCRGMSAPVGVFFATCCPGSDLLCFQKYLWAIMRSGLG